MTVSCVDVIMSKAENLMELEPAMDDAISILEACSFQDIVGQRLAKVTELLETLEERFHSLVHETGIADKLDAVSDENSTLSAAARSRFCTVPRPRVMACRKMKLMRSLGLDLAPGYSCWRTASTGAGQPGPAASRPCRWIYRVRYH